MWSRSVEIACLWINEWALSNNRVIAILNVKRDNMMSDTTRHSLAGYKYCLAEVMTIVHLVAILFSILHVMFNWCRQRRVMVLVFTTLLNSIQLFYLTINLWWSNTHNICCSLLNDFTVLFRNFIFYSTFFRSRCLDFRTNEFRHSKAQI